MLKKLTAAVLIMGSLQMGVIQCYGGFRLTAKFNGFVRSIGNKWIRWIIFLVTSWLYVLTILADVIFFNSIEFWAGYNPIGMNEYDEKGEHVKIEEKGDEKVVFTYRKFGQELRIQAYKKGDLVQDVFLKKDQPEKMFKYENGQLATYTMNMRKLENRTHVQIVRNGEVQYGHSMNQKEYANIIESKKHLARSAWVQ
jgi:hypothetical protein